MKIEIRPLEKFSNTPPLTSLRYQRGETLTLVKGKVGFLCLIYTRGLFANFLSYFLPKIQYWNYSVSLGVLDSLMPSLTLLAPS